MKRLLLWMALLAGGAAAQVRITTVSLPDGYTSGLFYNQQLSATITGPLANAQTIAWSLPAGTFLPPGLNLDTAGNITGFPTTAGAYTFTVKVKVSFTDFSDSRTLTLTIGTPRIAIGTANPLADGVLNQPYQVVFQANANPILTVQWGVSGASLPPGLSITPQGVLSGLPFATGVYTFNVSAFLASKFRPACSGSIHWGMWPRT